jgi:hypothetical protein
MFAMTPPRESAETPAKQLAKKLRVRLVYCPEISKPD